MELEDKIKTKYKERFPGLDWEASEFEITTSNKFLMFKEGYKAAVEEHGKGPFNKEIKKI